MIPEKKSNPVATVAIIVGIVAVIAYGGYRYNRKTPDSIQVFPNGNTGTASQDVPVDTGNSQTNTTAVYLYKDGDYTSMGNYYAPSGPEEISVSLTLKDDAVTAVTLVPQATNSESLKYQKKVASVISANVVGKKIDTLNLGKVSGSSLTPKGFNDAVAKIKVSAKA